MVTLQCNQTQFTQIQAVVFDKDGTLADSQEFLHNLGQRRARLIDAQIPGVQDPLLMAFGLDGGKLNPAGLMAVGTRYETEIAAAAYVAETGRDWIEALRISRSAFLEADTVMRRKADYTPLFPGVTTLLQTLTAAGLKLGILSADTTANVEDFIDRYQLGPWIQVGFGIDAGPGKPDPTRFLQICEAMAVSPTQVLAIGDSVADLEMARAANAAGCIGVGWGWTPANVLKQADSIITTFSDLHVIE